MHPSPGSRDAWFSPESRRGSCSSRLQVSWPAFVSLCHTTTHGPYNEPGPGFLGVPCSSFRLAFFWTLQELDRSMPHAVIFDNLSLLLVIKLFVLVAANDNHVANFDRWRCGLPSDFGVSHLISTLIPNLDSNVYLTYSTIYVYM